ncbi:ABC transporter permease [Tengunoibacter tsumagoiensis]|uniref:ABC transporter permease n=1 Tax=Tengunoibacter tsumagoiensis TaxID=2014871 RepID=A0A401ZWS9_9CHLR|nr:ABC transporter permease subunit [Tengunoibacter tsumagoiensis]GCE11317.1 hypothetical protein KTT_11760 [Tengunoibacter tsumagoiensis]
MSSQSQFEPMIATPVRSKNVIMGSQNYLNVLFRSIGGELYKLRRRLMPKIVLLVASLVVIAAFALISTTAIYQASRSPESFGGFTCNNSEECSQAAVSHDQGVQLKHQAVEAAASPLHLPGSLNQAVGIVNFIGVIVLVILTATIVGGEYSVGTIRIMLSRGPTRTQFFLAKLGTVLIAIFGTLLFLVVVGIITGALFNLIPGGTIDFSFLTGTWLLHAFLLLLIATLGIFTYCSIAFCLSTLGKATAAGLAGGLIWWFLESIIAPILTFIGSSIGGGFGDFLKAVPDYFIGPNISALLINQNVYLENDVKASPISDLHALLVILAYLIVLLGGSWWVQQNRDVTN